MHSTTPVRSALEGGLVDEEVRSVGHELESTQWLVVVWQWWREAWNHWHSRHVCRLGQHCEHYANAWLPLWCVHAYE